MKFCKDCKWCEFRPGFGRTIGFCNSPRKTPVVDPVTGEKRFQFNTCEVLRGDVEGRCGPDAQWFESLDPVYAERAAA